MTTPAPTSATTPDISYAPPAGGGRFVWHDLMTTDAARAHAFYSALFGWTTQVMPMGEFGDYQMVSVGEHGVGGIVPLEASHGIPSHWIAYLAVGDVDAACARIDATGGKTCVPPTDIPTIGRFAVCEDPSGALFSPFRPLDGPTSEPPMRGPAGTVAWNELLTTDPQAMAAFYAPLLGWTHETMDMGEQGCYWLFRRGGEFAAGMMQMPPAAEARPHWLPYFAVASADAAAERITALGGTRLHGPVDIQDWGRMAVAQDPTGAYFAVLEDKH
ncbi:MAG: VOC family protein [Gemmatirosa sp.]